MANIEQLLQQRQMPIDEALSVFDSLPEIDVDFMFGSWTGFGIDTGHPMDGLLEHFGWHGKRFHSAEHVDPLVFLNAKGRPVALDPRRMFAGSGLSDRVVRTQAMAKAIRLSQPLMATLHSAARLRRTGYRDKVTATMMYDQLPINDVFVKIDERRVLGVMDQKGAEQPFVFVLEREG